MDSALLLVKVLDLVGTFVFALSGAARGVERGMDLFGVLVLAFVTAVAGGIMRDVMIGVLPPQSVADWHNLALAVVAGLLVFWLPRLLHHLNRPVQLFDAAGLGVFAVAGTQKALDHGINWPMAAILGMISGIGGGMARDILTMQVPTVLRSDIYAVAALAGALVVVLGRFVGAQPILFAVAGIMVCVFLRVMGLYGGWKLPAAPKSHL